MMKFSRHRTLAEIKRLASPQLTIDTAAYDAGGDHIKVAGSIEGVLVELLYSTVNGRFFGRADGALFSSDEQRDGEPWFDGLLHLFYVAKAAAYPPQRTSTMDTDLIPPTAEAVKMPAPKVVAETPSHPGALNIGGRLMLPNARGGFDALAMIDPVTLLQDQTVKSIIGYAQDLSAQIARFKGHTFDDINSFLDLIAEKYGAKRGGKKGNLTLTSYDECMKVELRVADRIVFGPQLQIARELVDECIASWSDGARDEIRALVDGAFNADKEGTVDRTALLKLRRLNIADPTWKKAMEALSDSIRTEGTTTYMRFARRADVNAPWIGISIDLAAVQPAGTVEPAAA